MFLNMMYYFNRDFPWRAKPLTGWWLGWSGNGTSTTTSFLRLVYSKKSHLREVGERETPSGEYYGGTTKCEHSDLPTMWQQSSCCPLSWLPTTTILLCWLWCQYTPKPCVPQQGCNN